MTGKKQKRKKPEQSKPEQKKKKPGAFYIFHTMVLLLMVVIFWFSAQNGEDSSEISNAFLLWLLDKVGSLISAGLEVWLTTWIRKVAHFTIYMMLGFCSAGTFASADKRLLQEQTSSKPGFLQKQASAIRGWIFAVCYAGTDEVHQIFIPGRAGLLRDVLLDSTGALAGFLLYIAVFGIAELTQRKRRKINGDTNS